MFIHLDTLLPKCCEESTTFIRQYIIIILNLVSKFSSQRSNNCKCIQVNGFEFREKNIYLIEKLAHILL